MAHLPDATDQLVRELLRQGLSIREVVRRTGVSYTTVHNRLHQLGLSGRTRGHVNAPDHPWHKRRHDVPS